MADTARGLSAPLWSLLLFCTIFWGQFFIVLAPSWSGGTYYDYGWLVPPFAMLFVWRRWKDLDLAQARPFAHRGIWLAVFVGVLLLFPLRLVEQVDGYWRLALWVHAGLVLTVTHLILILLYGLGVSARILPATLFALLAVPIPSPIELELVQGLTRQVVNLATGALPLAGYPVEVAGNSLVIRGELLDVAEGCSGIRSFQSSAMAGLCLGELLRLAPWKRGALLLVSLLLAAVCNAGRVFVLARVAHDEGRAASDAAHDSVGFWVLILTYGGISLAAWGLLQVRAGARKVSRTVGGPNG